MVLDSSKPDLRNCSQTWTILNQMITLNGQYLGLGILSQCKVPD